MRLAITQQECSVHKTLVSAVGWTPLNELYTCSDDQTVHRWNSMGEPSGQVLSLDTYITDMQWFPVASRARQGASSDCFAISCTDGTFKIFSGSSGRADKDVSAHKGAIISIRWSWDGSSIATAGEDGFVKIWSRNGQIRSTLARQEGSVYAVAWSPDSQQVLFSCGRYISIKPLQSAVGDKQRASKPVQWRAHDGVILKVDWSPVNQQIISGGEDRKFKVWDNFGRLLHTSTPLPHPVTALRWSPSGSLFAVGSFNTLALCDQTGWTASQEHLESKGSVMSICWTLDGTQLAAGSSSGCVLVAQVLGITLESGRLRASLDSPNEIHVVDLLESGHSEALGPLRDRVVKMALGFGHLLVATTSQLLVYSMKNWGTPSMLDLKDIVTCLALCERLFLVVDNFSGLQVFAYDGRQVCNPRFSGLQAELLNGQEVSLANDCVAVLDQSNNSSIKFFDTAQGKALGEPIKHSLEIRALQLNQAGTLPVRQVAFIDRNRDLYLSPVLHAGAMKLASVVDSCLWHDTTNMLAATVDSKLTVWYYPNAVFLDRDLLPQTKFVKHDAEYGKIPQVVSFAGARCVVRLYNGAQMAALVLPYPIMLHKLLRNNQWSQAMRLCRFVKEPALWSCLACMAVAATQLPVAEAAFAAIEEVDKLRFVRKVQRIPHQEARKAEMLLYMRQPAEAERLLLSAGLVFAAIMLNVRIFNWHAAMRIAQQHKSHIDTVLWYRQRHLASMGSTESMPDFQRLAAEIPLDEHAIRSKIRAEAS